MSGRVSRAVVVAAVAVLIVAGLAASRLTPGRTNVPSPSVAAARSAAADLLASPVAATSTFDFVEGGWGWRLAAGTIPARVSAVPGGFVGQCVEAGTPTACSSLDGVRWSIGADPHLFPDGLPDGFDGWNVAHGGSVWLATSGIGPDVWRSDDGRHWERAIVGASGFDHADLVSVDGGVALIADRLRDATGPAVLVTADGRSWHELALPTGAASVSPGGAIGVVATGTYEYADQPTPMWASGDGTTWHALSLPPSVRALQSVVQARGRFAAISTDRGAPGVLLRSSDGLAWEHDASVFGTVSSIGAIGDREFATGYPAGNDFLVLAATDAIGSWHEIARLDTPPLRATTAATLGNRLALFDGSRLLAVGEAVPGPSSTLRPTPTATAPASPGPSEERILGGWRWHPLVGLPFDGQLGAGPVKLPNGYLARCAETLCTSRDGWSWQSPPDPGIFRADVPARFTPFTVARAGSGTYLMRTGTGFWRSTDGVAWSHVAGPDIAAVDTLLGGADGFAVFGSTGGSPEGFLSPDGLEWTKEPDDPPVYGGCYGDTSSGLVAGIRDKTNFMFTRDGRTWSATSPRNTALWGCPSRLSDGTLFLAGLDRLVRSTDGVTWSVVATPSAPQSVVATGGALVVTGLDRDGTTATWVSEDEGRTFVPFLAEVQVAQFADLVAVRLADGWFVGAPLTPEERATLTPSPPVSVSPVTPAPYSPEPAPTGGISREEAIGIAIGAAQVSPAMASTATAGVTRGFRGDRWTWSVSFRDGPVSPTGGSGVSVEIDYFTGEVLSVGRWIG